MLKRLMWLLSLIGVLSFTSCGVGSDEAKELLQRLLRLVGIPHDIVVNICQDNNNNGFCESIEPHVSIVMNQGDTAQTLWQKITETADGQYLLETYNPEKPILVELQDVAKVNYDEGKFTLVFDGFESKEDDNETKEISILESMVDADAITVAEADKFRTLNNEEAQNKFYVMLLDDIETNINTLRRDGLDSKEAVEATIKEMGDETKANQAVADSINACADEQTCVDKEIDKVSDELIITESESAEITNKNESNQTVEPTPQPVAPSGEEVQNGKWVKPSQSVCESNGGESYIDTCRAPWESAKTICSATGGVLPNIETLNAVVTDCGGESYVWASDGYEDKAERNRENESYQACYEEKGFNGTWYWSSRTLEEDSSAAWEVYFYYGADYYYDKSARYYVLCIR